MDGKDADGDNVNPERALIPQSHGGALRPFNKGNGPGSGGAARRSPIRSNRKRALELLNQGTPEAARKLMSLVRDRDTRVAVIAAKEILDRTLGRPSESPQGEEHGSHRVSIDHLNDEQRVRLAEALATVQELTGAGFGSQPNEPAPAGPEPIRPRSLLT